MKNFFINHHSEIDVWSVFMVSDFGVIFPSFQSLSVDCDTPVSLLTLYGVTP